MIAVNSVRSRTRTQAICHKEQQGTWGWCLKVRLKASGINKLTFCLISYWSLSQSMSWPPYALPQCTNQWWKTRTCTRKCINCFSPGNFTQAFSKSVSLILLFPKWVTNISLLPKGNLTVFFFTAILWFSPCIRVKCCSSFPNVSRNADLRCSFPGWSHASWDNQGR